MSRVSEPGSGEFQLPGVLDALSGPVRLGIVGKFERRGDVQCGTFCVNIARSTRSHHLKVLREAGITLKRRRSAARS